MPSKARKLIEHVVPAIIKPIRVLWNEMMGFVFLCLGLIPIPGGIRAYQEFQHGGEGGFRVVLTLLFCGVMLYFGVTSFLRARKISRS
jgi:hypothetical protein